MSLGGWGEEKMHRVVSPWLAKSCSYHKVFFNYRLYGECITWTWMCVKLLSINFMHLNMTIKTFQGFFRVVVDLLFAFIFCELKRNLRFIGVLLEIILCYTLHVMSHHQKVPCICTASDFVLLMDWHAYILHIFNLDKQIHRVSFHVLAWCHFHFHQFFVLLTEYKYFSKCEGGPIAV